MRFTACLLMIALLAGLLAGCGEAAASGEATRPGASDSAVTTTCAAAEPETTEPEPLPEISWSTAFRTKDVPEGTVAADSIAFLRREADGTTSVFNVPIEEVYAQQPERLPRTHYFEQYMPQVLVDELLPVLDYAMANGCSRMCFPSTELRYGTVVEAKRWLDETYLVNLAKISAYDIRSFRLSDEKTLSFLLVTLEGMERADMMEQYREGVSAAKTIVDAMPENLSEREKMFYLYRYLTDNVRYYDYDEFSGEYYSENEWSLLYDTLVRHSTVCAGYAEALYVLCNLAGIECIELRGVVRQTGHAWNAARIDGQFYLFDATWDAGSPPSDYWYFGTSTEFNKNNHEDYLTGMSRQYCPICPDSLWPDPDAYMPEDCPKEVASLTYWYYWRCNLRDYAPAWIFDNREPEKVGEPEDGWVSTEFDADEFRAMLTAWMSDELADAYCSESFRTDENGCVSYRVPAEDWRLSRCVGMEENEDGSWTTTVMELTPDGSYTLRKDRLTLEEYEDHWRVTGVETGVE